MGFPVKLSDIIEAIDFQSEESSAYLNKNNGEIISVTEEDLKAAENQDPLEEYPEWQHESIEMAQEILAHEGDFIGLPTKYEVDEYQIMENFILSINDREIADTLFSAIKGRGAFRSFKDGIIRFDIEHEWYKYRGDAIRQVAVDWCELHNIPFKEE